MSTYVVIRPFDGKGVGESIEVPDPRRADILQRRRYISPLKTQVPQVVVDPAVVVKAISLIAVSKLGEFLAVVDDADSLVTALGAETRETAAPLIEARLDELGIAPDGDIPDGDIPDGDVPEEGSPEGDPPEEDAPEASLEELS